EAVRKSPAAGQARAEICRFWQEHQPQGTSTDITQYVSLALELGPAPLFTPVLPEADLPPDAAHVLGVIPLLQKFYQAAGTHGLVEKAQGPVGSPAPQFHGPVTQAHPQASP